MQLVIDREKDDPPSTIPARGWAGWFRARRGEPFVKLAEAADYNACWELLLDILAQRGQRGGDSLVAARGVDPNRGASARRPATAGR